MSVGEGAKSAADALAETRDVLGAGQVYNALYSGEEIVGALIHLARKEMQSIFRRLAFRQIHENAEAMQGAARRGELGASADEEPADLAIVRADVTEFCLEKGSLRCCAFRRAVLIWSNSPGREEASSSATENGRSAGRPSMDSAPAERVIAPDPMSRSQVAIRPVSTASLRRSSRSLTAASAISRFVTSWPSTKIPVTEPSAAVVGW